jgi:hypothetical protein
MLRPYGRIAFQLYVFDLFSPLDSQNILLRDFLSLTECPLAWRQYDLYLFRDGDTVFYVGQSYCAYERVWEHLRGDSRDSLSSGCLCCATGPARCGSQCSCCVPRRLSLIVSRTISAQPSDP